MDVQWVGAGLTAAIVVVSFAKFLSSGFAQIRQELQGVRGEIDNLRGKMSNLPGQMDGMRGDMNGIRGQVEEMRSETSNLRGEMNGMHGAMQKLREDLRGDIVGLVTQQREDYGNLSPKLGEVAERTARMKGLLFRELNWRPQATAAQAVPRK